MVGYSDPCIVLRLHDVYESVWDCEISL